MRKYIQRKVRALFLYHFRDDLRTAYDRGYINGLEDAGGPAFEDGFEAGVASVDRHGIFMAGWRQALHSQGNEKPCTASPS